MESKMTLNAFGNKEWRNEEGQRHREDGPAIEHADGHKSWYISGQRHREDGPAVEHANGDKSWWVRGKKVYELKAGQPYPPEINRLICALFYKIEA